LNSIASTAAIYIHSRSEVARKMKHMNITSRVEPFEFIIYSVLMYPFEIPIRKNMLMFTGQK
jgi:hypothetical protein